MSLKLRANFGEKLFFKCWSRSWGSSLPDASPLVCELLLCSSGHAGVVWPSCVARATRAGESRRLSICAFAAVYVCSAVHGPRAAEPLEVQRCSARRGSERLWTARAGGWGWASCPEVFFGLLPWLWPRSGLVVRLLISDVVHVSLEVFN